MFKGVIFSLFSAVLLAMNGPVMADLVLAEGGGTGTWFNATRSGEGFYVEIVASPGGGNAVSIAMYSFDDNGDPFWLVGYGNIGDQDTSASFSVFAYDGPVWGPGYDPNDLNETAFGTITVRFPTCDTAYFSLNSNTSLESFDYSLIRLTNVEGLNCQEPPDPPPTGLVTGAWTGPGVCFMVSEDGSSIFGGDLSVCDAQTAFRADLEGITTDLDECNANTDCEGVWPIVDGKFTCVNERGEMAIGEFNSTTGASGSVLEGDGGQEVCRAEWTATPVN